MKTCVCGHSETDHHADLGCWADDPNGAHGMCKCMKFIEQPTLEEVRQAEQPAKHVEANIVITKLDKIIDLLNTPYSDKAINEKLDKIISLLEAGPTPVTDVDPHLWIGDQKQKIKQTGYIARMRDGGVQLVELLDAFAYDGESLATVLNCLSFLGLGTAQPDMPDEDAAVWDGGFTWVQQRYPDDVVEERMEYHGNKAAGGPESGSRHLVVREDQLIQLF